MSFLKTIIITIAINLFSALSFSASATTLSQNYGTHKQVIQNLNTEKFLETKPKPKFKFRKFWKYLVLATAILTFLKFAGVLTLSWYIVLAPIIIVGGIYTLLILLLIFIIAYGVIVDGTPLMP